MFFKKKIPKTSKQLIHEMQSDRTREKCRSIFGHNWVDILHQRGNRKFMACSKCLNIKVGLEKTVSMGRYEIEYSWVTEEYRQKILNRLQLVDNKITIIPNPTRKVVEEIDLGINFNGYPLGESHADIIDAIADHVYEAVPLSKRETKNLNYVVVLYALEDDV